LFGRPKRGFPRKCGHQHLLLKVELPLEKNSQLMSIVAHIPEDRNGFALLRRKK